MFGLKPDVSRCPQPVHSSYWIPALCVGSLGGGRAAFGLPLSAAPEPHRARQCGFEPATGLGGAIAVVNPRFIRQDSTIILGAFIGSKAAVAQVLSLSHNQLRDLQPLSALVSLSEAGWSPLYLNLGAGGFWIVTARQVEQ